MTASASSSPSATPIDAAPSVQDTPGAGVLAAFSNELAATVERVGQSVVRVDAGRRFPGSGVVWDANLIITADHVIESEEGIEVGLPDGATARATIAGRDENSDLALLRVEGGTLTPLARGGAPRVGQLALVVARPGSSVATSIGVVGASGALRGGGGRGGPSGQSESYIWTDASFYPGFGGGAFVDTEGRLLGLATSTSRTGAGIAIPLETIERVVASLQRHGRIRRGFLGIGSQQVELPEALRTRLGLSQAAGLLIMGVESGGPADKAGLIIGDVLVSLGGQAVEDHQALLGLLGPDRVGQATPVRVLRGGELRDATVTVGERRAD